MAFLQDAPVFELTFETLLSLAITAFLTLLVAMLAVLYKIAIEINKLSQIVDKMNENTSLKLDRIIDEISEISDIIGDISTSIIRIESRIGLP